MRVPKLTMYIFSIFLAVVLLMPVRALHAESCQNCTVTVTNNAGNSVDITLDYSPSGSDSRSQSLGAVAPGQTATFQVPADKCPLRLGGQIWYGYRTSALTDRCPGENREGSPFTTCTVSECKSSTWSIGGSGGGFHFNRQ